MHKVKCAICGKELDTDVVQAVKHGTTRYSHQSCEPDNKNLVPLAAPKVVTEENKEKKELMDYINSVYKDKANWALIQKQLKEFVKRGYTYTGMKKALIYFYEVKHNSVEGSMGGIGILQYCYEEAKTYFYDLFLIQEANKSMNIIEEKTEIIEIKPPNRKKSLFKKLFDLEGDN